MDYQIIKIGWSHHHSPIEFRDQLVLRREEMRQFVLLAVDNPHIAELAVLSTCNRIEFYALAESLVYVFAAVKNQYSNVLKRNINWHQSSPEIYTNLETIQHLHRVATGMESMVLGESQILSQVKAAQHTMIQNHPDSDVLSKLFYDAVNCAEIVRKCAPLFSGPTSISELAVITAGGIYNNLEQQKVLIIGAGETAELTASYFKASGVKQIVIANRSEKRGRALAKSIGCNQINMHQINDILYECDVIVTATNARDYLIDKEQIKSAMKDRKNILLLDLSMPRNIDPTIRDIDDICFYDLDHLDDIASKNRGKNKEALVRAEMIIQNHSRKVMAWFNLRDLQVSNLESIEDRD